MDTCAIPPKSGFFIYAEDDPDAVLLVRMALRKINAEHLMIHCRDGEELIARLTLPEARDDVPAFILLDVRMPKVDGFEVLRWIRGIQKLHTVPVVMLTSSPLARDIQRAQALGAGDYIVKPGSFDELCKTVASLVERFFRR